MDDIARTDSAASKLEGGLARMLAASDGLDFPTPDDAAEFLTGAQQVASIAVQLRDQVTPW